MVVRLQANKREDASRSSLRSLRENGKIPAVVYGKSVSATPIAVDMKELISLIKSDNHRVIELEVPEQGNRPVIIREIQRDSLNRNILHVDFREVDLLQPIKTMVRIDFSGLSPGVQNGGMLQIQMHEVEIQALPQMIPSSLEADMSSLDLGGHLLAGDLIAPEGLEILTDLEEVIATILAPRKEEVLEPEAKAADDDESGSVEKEKAEAVKTE